MVIRGRSNYCISHYHHSTKPRRPSRSHPGVPTPAAVTPPDTEFAGCGVSAVVVLALHLPTVWYLGPSAGVILLCLAAAIVRTINAGIAT